MDVVGYAIVKKGADIKGAKNPEDFTFHRVRVMEFDPDGGALVLNPNGDALGMVEQKDIQASFKCQLFNGAICPPNMDISECAIYFGACMTRNGGYGNIVREMVIAASLHRGEFCDSVLWEKNPVQKAALDALLEVHKKATSKC